MSYYKDERQNYSHDSVRPLSNPEYHSAPTGPETYDNQPQRKKGVSPWVRYLVAKTHSFGCELMILS